MGNYKSVKSKRSLEKNKAEIIVNQLKPKAVIIGFASVSNNFYCYSEVK